jgi:hypothetical protein
MGAFHRGCWYFRNGIAYRVGSGLAPAAASFASALDPSVVRDVKVGAARLNRRVHDAGVRLVSRTQTSSLFETRWRTSVTLNTRDQLGLDLEVSTRELTASLPSIEHR